MRRGEARPAARARPLSYLLTLLVAGCSSYDSSLLERPGNTDAATADAQVGGDAATGRPPDAGPGGSRRDGALADAAGGAGAEAGSADAAPPDASGVDATAAGDAASTADAGNDGGACGVGGMDCCPQDPDKTAPGACGCGTPDTDGDSDGSPDCQDACPADPDKTTSAGQCGCGAPESLAAECQALASALRHRYRFRGSGTAAIDAVSGANGVIMGATLDGSGALTLAGGTSDEYVDLPDGLVSELTNATFEVWITWQGGDAWQRIFDFGDSNGGSGNQGSAGVSYLFLTPQTSGGGMRAAFSLSGGGNEVRVSTAAPLDTGVVRHLAVVVADQSELRLYLDGVPQGAAALTESLSSIADVNAWLGRSQYQADPELSATIHELRIYDAALDDAQVAASFTLGPDPALLEP